MSTYNKLYMVTLDANLNSKEKITVLVRAENEHVACKDARDALMSSGFTDVNTRECREVSSFEVSE